MMSNRQPVVKHDADAQLASFIADVLELGGLLRRVADDIAGAQGETQTVWYALSVLADKPLTVSQAARRLGVSRQAVQRTANDLLVRQLATSLPNPDHRTAPLIGLTSKGKDVLAQISLAASAKRHRWFTDDDVNALIPAHDQIRLLCDSLRDHVR